MVTPQEIESKKIYQEMGMTTAEFEAAKKLLGRLPNYTETGLFSVMWSEHCSYKNTKRLLRTFPTKGARVLQGPGEGAGIIDIGDNLAAVFKLESHNHPSAVEPFAGASTGLGGIIRDVFSMGARPVAMLNSLRFGEPDAPDTGKRTRFLFEEIVKGMADYGNGIGVPTVGGEIQFDGCYAGNPLVNAMCVGLLRHEDIRTGQAKGAGNLVMYAGGKTGRDGVHGATFASTELSDEPARPPSIPQGYPEIGRPLMEACLEVIKHPALVGIQDMGAAGLISSSSEMAAKGGTGIELDLDAVPQKEDGMIPYEIMLSESQERMLLIVETGREGEIAAIFGKHGIDTAVIGKVTDDGMVRLLHNGEVCAEVSADALVESAPEYEKPAREAAYFAENQMADTAIHVTDYADTLLKLLAQPTIASKHWVWGHFDGSDTVLVPPGSDAGVVAVPGTNKALAMTVDCNSRYVYLDPYVGAKIAVAECARNIAASGGLPLAITDNLNFGSPENPEIFWQLEEAVRGISEAVLEFDTPVIGGNVSLYNEHGGGAIFPTPTIGMVGLIEKCENILTAHFKKPGDLIYLIGTTKAKFGGSELQKLLHGKIFGRPPAIDLKEESKNIRLILDANRQGLLRSAHDISEGGLAVAVAECLFGAAGSDDAGGSGGAGVMGAEIFVPNINPTAFLFSESGARFVVSVPIEKKDAFEKLCDASLIGLVTGDGRLRVEIVDKESFAIGVPQMKDSWEGSIECLLKTD